MWDLEATHLQIKTNSTPGSNEVIKVPVHELGGLFISRVVVLFSSPMQYKIPSCTSGSQYVDLPVQPHIEAETIWTITKTEAAITITCNDVEVLKYKFADSPFDSCVEKLGGNVVGQIKFAVDDTASNFYRAVSARYPSWKAVVPDTPITWDLEKQPLFIKTDSEDGSEDLLRLFTIADNGTELASFTLQYTTPTIQYRIGRCDFNGERWITNVLAEPLADEHKVWKIAKNSSSLTVSCNAVNVLVVSFSDSTNEAVCRPAWEGDIVGQIMFVGPIKSSSLIDDNIDTASDYYSNGDPWSLIGKLNYN
eukprot:sb/3467168/